MTLMNRRYSGYEDFIKIREFLEECVSITGPKFYMNLGFFDFQWVSDFSSENYIGGLDEMFKDVHLWFEDNKLIGGFWPWGSEINIFIHPNKKSFFTEMVDVAEITVKETITENNQDENIQWEIFDGDVELEEVLKEKGYCKNEEYRPHRVFKYNGSIEIPELPEGYCIKTLKEISDKDRLFEIYRRCLGMNKNEAYLENITKTSTYRNELDVVVMGSDHKVAAFCSGQYDKKNKMASFEAVACSSDHRKKGLSKVMMLTALRNAQVLGAESATIQTSWQKAHPAPNRLYESVGFELVGNLYFWEKSLSNV